MPVFFSSFFLFTDTATTEIYTLSLHDALPISALQPLPPVDPQADRQRRARAPANGRADLFLQAHEHQCPRSEEHTSELQSQSNLVCRLLLEKKKKNFTFISKFC